MGLGLKTAEIGPGVRTENCGNRSWDRCENILDYLKHDKNYFWRKIFPRDEIFLRVFVWPLREGVKIFFENMKKEFLMSSRIKNACGLSMQFV